MSGDLLIQGGQYLDVAAGEWRRADIRIVSGVIAEIGPSLRSSSEETVEAAGMYVLPGLIDCHVHVTAVTADLAALSDLAPSYVAFGTAEIMGQMLDRGFTTVRDVAGADHGVHQAQSEGLLRGPRVLFGGKAISQTGGHGDIRPAGRTDVGSSPSGLSRIADGVDAVRHAVRDELRRGAHHIKVMASGGVASPTDRIDSNQYSVEELRAAVEEAEAANRYVTVHAYTAQAIKRALESGVHGIEHGNLLDEESIDMLKERDASLTMNLVTYWALQQEGRQQGLPEESWSKVAAVLDAGYDSMSRVHAAGIVPAFGSDLLGGMHRHQAREFAIRADILPNIDVIRSATTVAAKVVRREGQLGVISTGAVGDLIGVTDDPLQDISVLAESRIPLVIQGGRIASPSRGLPATA